MRGHIRLAVCIQRTIRAESQMIMQVCAEGFDVSIGKFLNHIRRWMVVRLDMTAHGDARTAWKSIHPGCAPILCENSIHSSVVGRLENSQPRQSREIAGDLIPVVRFAIAAQNEAHLPQSQCQHDRVVVFIVCVKDATVCLPKR